MARVVQIQNMKKQVSESDDSESVDDPSPVPLVESTRLDKSSKKKNLGNKSQEHTRKDSNAGSDVSNIDSSDSVRNSKDKQGKKNKSSTEVSVEPEEGSGNDSEDLQATFSVKDLSSDDEVYLFQSPEDFELHVLLNKTMDITKSKQIVHTIDGEKFQLDILSTENKQVTLAVPEKSSKGKLFNLPLKGLMVLKKVIEMDSVTSNYLDEVDDSVVFPNDIKVRHPFLGVNWKSYIDSAREVIGKSKSNEKLKKKMKKEKRKENSDEENKKRKSVFETSSPKKRYKKE